MSNFLNNIPVSPIKSLGNPSVRNNATFGTNFSILQTGGYMEVYNLTDLDYIIPNGYQGLVEYSGNTIPVQLQIGTGQIFSPNVLTLNSDNISSGRRKLGMLVYVYETKKIYQYNIDNYDTLWNNATGATGPGGSTVVISNFGTTVKNNSPEGIVLINAWTASTISGINGYDDTNASWRVLQTFTGGTVTGATIFTDGLTANTISATTYQNLPATPFLPLSGGTVTGATIFTDGLTANTISATTYQNLPATPFLPLSGGTVTGATIFTDGLTANTISATTYYNLPKDVFITGGTYFQGNTIFTNSTGGTFNIFGPSNYDPGVISGNTGWSSNNDGSINLPQITVALYDNPNFFEPLKFYSISSGTTGVGSLPALINNDTNYIIIEYNNGVPRYNVLDNEGTVDFSSILLYMIVYRTNNFIHVLEFGDEGAGLPSKLNERIVYTDRFARESGCSLGLSGSTGIVTLSSGVVWNATNRQIVNDTTSLGLFFRNFHSGGTWVYTTTANTINNLYYDNGTDLVSATAGKYLVNWYFRGQELNDHLYEVVSDGQFDNILLADASSEPNLPELITSHAFLVGRIIIEVSATTGITQSAFSSVFQPSGAPGVHNDLTNIQGGLPNQYYHLDSNKYNNLALTNTNNNFSAGQTFASGLTATTISATTYQNLPPTPFLPLSGGTVTGQVILKNNSSPLIITTDNYSPGISGNILFYGDITGSTNGKSISSRSNGGGNPGNLILQELGNGNVGVNTNVVNPILNFNLDVNGTFGATSVSATTYFNLPATPFLPLSGGTVTGATNFTGGLTATTISATTYQNLPPTPFLPLSGGTVTGATIFTGGLTANTISATTISGGTVVLNSTNLPSTPIAVSAFTDDYNRVTLSPGGSPSLTYTNTNTGAGNATITASTYLNIANGNPAGQSYTTVPLSGFNSPFNPTLSLNTVNVEWSFNLRTNRNTIFPGFSAGTYGAAVVLAGTSGTLLNTGNGYALVYGGTGTRNWRLVRYTSGLFGTRTDIISGGVFAAGTNYVSARIVYTPSTNTWTYYFRDDGAVAWGDPTTVTTLIGSAVDSTYTSSLMSSLGVFFNYSTAANQNLQFDNLVVKLNSPSVFTPQSYLTLKNYANTEVFDVKDDGSVTSTGLISSTGGISGTTISGGTYFGNGSALTLGQFGTMITGSTSLLVTNTTTLLTLIPGLTTTITVPTQTMVCIQTNGGVNTVGTTTTSGSAIDVALVVDGIILPNGGYQRMYADNPTGNATVGNWVANWNMSVIITLSAGIHTVEVDTATVQGQNATVSGGFGAINQGTLTIMILKNT
jgi:hypothetical protein